MGIRLIPAPPEDDIWFVRSNLREYNRRHFETTESSKYVAFFEDRWSTRNGGIVWTEFGDWVDIEYLWVSDEHRRRGIGTGLLNAAITHAGSTGRTRAYTTTYSFQALPFYRRFGFDIVYERRGYPRTSTLYHLELDLRGIDTGRETV